MKKHLITMIGILACLCLMACGGTAEKVLPLTQGDSPDYTETMDSYAESTVEPTKEPTSTPTPTATPVPTATPTPTPVKTRSFGMTGGSYELSYHLDGEYLYYMTNQNNMTLQRANMNTGTVEVMLTNLGDVESYVIANGNIYYRDGDAKCWFSMSLATGEKKIFSLDYYAGTIYIYEDLLYYSRTVNITASTTEKQLVQVKEFDSDFPEEKVVHTAKEGTLSIAKVNEDGSFLVQTGYQKFEKGLYPFGTQRYIYEYIVFSPEGKLLADAPTYRGYQTFTKSGFTYGVGWIGNSIEEADRYGFVDFSGDNIYDEEISEIIARCGTFQISGDILFYGCSDGICAYDLESGKRATVIIDPGIVKVAAGNYVYYEYDHNIYRVRTDGTGWEPVR